MKKEKCYINDDGVTYSKDKKTLIKAPVSITHCKILEETETIKESAFERCINISEIIIPGNVRNISKNAFYCCFNLKEVILPEGLVRIDEYSFCGCIMLERITLPSTVESIGNVALDSVKSIVIPASVKHIEGNPFSSCEKIENLSAHFSIINDALYTADGKQLIHCFYKGKDYRIADGTQSIRGEAFSSLRRITIPESLETWIVTYVYSLERITFLGEVDEIHFHNAFYNSFPKLCRIIVPKGALEYYKKILKISVNEMFGEDHFPSRPVKLTKRILSPSERDIPSVLDLVPVKGGSFSMGSDEKKAPSWIMPAHEVTVSDFYIGRYPVTQKIWRMVMCKNPSASKGMQLPVEFVSWFDCIEFCNALSRHFGFRPCYRIDYSKLALVLAHRDCAFASECASKKKTDTLARAVSLLNDGVGGFRLATDAEWEYAARGGQLSFGYKYAGSDNLDEVAWYDGNSCHKTHNVGTKRPNELGLYDMAGNVESWCWDWFGDYLPFPQTNPQGPCMGKWRVVRGCSYQCWPDFEAEVAARSHIHPSYANRCIGLRIVLSL
jgi:formylglycine-generating enzyme required for sulfatase activity